MPIFDLIAFSSLAQPIVTSFSCSLRHPISLPPPGFTPGHILSASALHAARAAPLGMRGVLIGKCDQNDRKRSERNVANTHCRDLPCLRRKSYVTNELDSSPTAKRSDALAAGFHVHISRKSEASRSDDESDPGNNRNGSVAHLSLPSTTILPSENGICRCPSGIA